MSGVESDECHYYPLRYWGIIYRRGGTRQDRHIVTGGSRKMGYYLCNNVTERCYLGPFDFAMHAARSIGDLWPLCVMSRYMLNKEGWYPRTLAGESELTTDLQYGIRDMLEDMGGV